MHLKNCFIRIALHSSESITTLLYKLIKRSLQWRHATDQENKKGRTWWTLSQKDMWITRDKQRHSKDRQKILTSRWDKDAQDVSLKKFLSQQSFLTTKLIKNLKRRNLARRLCMGWEEKLNSRFGKQGLALYFIYTLTQWYIVRACIKMSSATKSLGMWFYKGRTWWTYMIDRKKIETKTSTVSLTRNWTLDLLDTRHFVLNMSSLNFTYATMECGYV